MPFALRSDTERNEWMNFLMFSLDLAALLFFPVKGFRRRRIKPRFALVVGTGGAPVSRSALISFLTLGQQSNVHEQQVGATAAGAPVLCSSSALKQQSHVHFQHRLVFSGSAQSETTSMWMASRRCKGFENTLFWRYSPNMATFRYLPLIFPKAYIVT